MVFINVFERFNGTMFEQFRKLFLFSKSWIRNSFATHKGENHACITFFLNILPGKNSSNAVLTRGKQSEITRSHSLWIHE